MPGGRTWGGWTCTPRTHLGALCPTTLIDLLGHLAITVPNGITKLIPLAQPHQRPALDQYDALHAAPHALCQLRLIRRCVGNLEKVSR